jgi:hypothetical protein
MILIDTSAWIEFFRRAGSRAAKERVAAYMDAVEAAYTCPVYFELLAGARDTEKACIEQALEFCERIPFTGSHWAKAAELERSLRKSGVTVPRDDLFVATVALAEGLSVLCRDSHFETMRDAGRLKLRIESLL